MDQQDAPRFLIQEPHWPTGLAEEHRSLLLRAGEFMARGELGSAGETFRAGFEVLLRRQPAGHRFHKGESLHNWGLALMLQGRVQEAFVETLAAFIEDAASLAEERTRPEELDRPAAHNLVYVYGVTGRTLIEISADVRGRVGAGELIHDPHALIGSDAGPAPADERLRIVGEFTRPPERRVFIGGWYGRLVEVLRPIRDHLAERGFDAVIAADFGTPNGWGQDEVARALMSMCHYGIFEVSESAGQVEEIAYSPETMRTPERMLAVFDLGRGDRPGVSAGMTLEKLRRWHVPWNGYADLTALKGMVESWMADA